MDPFNNQAQPNPAMSTSGCMPNRPPGENDVILGAGCNKHCGNLKFQQFIKAYKRARFRTNPKIETAEAVKEVVEFWRRLSPRGRFLAQNKNSNDGKWHEVDDKQAMRIASFFLMNGKGGGELKRQKSIDAMRRSGSKSPMSGPPLMRSQSGPQPQMQRGSGLGPDLTGSGMGGSSHGQRRSIQGQPGCVPDMMAGLEPMPIGPSSSNSMAQKQQQIRAQIHSIQEPATSSSQDLDPFDFNPLPFKPNNKDPLDDFEPISFSNNNNNNSSSSRNNNNNNNFASGNKSVDVSTNAQFGGAPDQVQVSVNMVVNTMPQGYPRGENGVNTVTNIQIGTGTINDERKQPSKPSYKGDNNGGGGGFPGQNFQLQISAQSNPNGMDERSMMKPVSSSQRQNQMNDFQVGFFGNQDNGSSIQKFNGMNGNGGAMGNSSNGVQIMNGGNGAGAMIGNNNGMQMMNGNGNNMMGNNMMGNNMMNMNNMAGQNGNMNMNNAAAGNGNGNGAGQNNALRWNKNEVANSVPCAASLVGSVFDDL